MDTVNLSPPAKCGSTSKGNKLIVKMKKKKHHRYTRKEVKLSPQKKVLPPRPAISSSPGNTKAFLEWACSHTHAQTQSHTNTKKAFLYVDLSPPEIKNIWMSTADRAATYNIAQSVSRLSKKKGKKKKKEMKRRWGSVCVKSSWKCVQNTEQRQKTASGGWQQVECRASRAGSVWQLSLFLSFLSSPSPSQRVTAWATGSEAHWIKPHSHRPIIKLQQADVIIPTQT